MNISIAEQRILHQSPQAKQEKRFSCSFLDIAIVGSLLLITPPLSLLVLLMTPLLSFLVNQSADK